MTGKWLVRVRTELGLYQNELADLIGVHHSSISEWESKGLECVPFKSFCKIRALIVKSEYRPPTLMQPPSPIYNLSYPASMALNPRLCVKQNDVENLQPIRVVDYATLVQYLRIKNATPKSTPILFSETTLSVGDISSQCLLNTGSASYKKLITWLDGV